MATDSTTQSPLAVTQPCIDVVITNHNYNRFVPGAVESALKQHNVQTRIVIVDDGSDEPLRGFESEERVQIIRREAAGGVGVALNLGLDAGSAPLVTFLDADDLWPLDRCRQLHDAISGADLAYGAQVVFADGDQPDLDPSPEQRAAMRATPAALLSGTVLLRRTLFDRYGPFPEQMSKAPFIFWMAAARAAVPAIREVALDRPVLLRRSHTSNMTRNNSQLADYFQVLAQRRREDGGH